jgi:F-type H+-transporting ATPase subunit a
MRAPLKIFAPYLLFLVSAGTVFASGGGVSMEAQELWKWGGFPITNSMATSWVVSLLIIIVVRSLVRKPELVPSRGQLIVESVIGGLRDIVEPIVGRKVFFPAFWLLSGLFVFILVNNWMGLIPGVGTIYGKDDHGHWVALIRPGNADLNMTFALAAVANLAWLYFIFRYAGPKAIVKDWFGNKANKGELHWGMFYFLGVIFLMVGVIEIVSIFFRPISLCFRLFGNVYGGESLLHKMFFIGGELGAPEWLSNVMMGVMPVPFYLLEVLIGLVQALVFMLLVSVYIGLLCNHGEEDGH